MKKILLLLLAWPLLLYAACPEVPQATPAQLQQWAAAAPDRGVLWRITRDGHSSYLYGTLHVGQASWFYPGPALKQAWTQTDTVALELDLSDPATLLALRDAPGFEPGPELQARLSEQVRAFCLPQAALAGMNPLLVVDSLSGLAAVAEGFDADHGQDMLLLSMALHESRPVVGLETAAMQLAALIPSDPKAAADDLDDGLKELENGSARRSLLLLAAAWNRGDLATLSHIERWCECLVDGQPDPQTVEQLRRINDLRNPHLALRISELHASGKRLLIGVGALHMTGPQALPVLLRGMGFTVERVVPAPKR